MTHYFGSLMRAILALSPHFVGIIPRAPKKPMVPRSEFVYSARGRFALAMSSKVCRGREIEQGDIDRFDMCDTHGMIRRRRVTGFVALLPFPVDRFPETNLK